MLAGPVSAALPVALQANPANLFLTSTYAAIIAAAHAALAARLALLLPPLLGFFLVTLLGSGGLPCPKAGQSAERLEGHCGESL